MKGLLMGIAVIGGIILGLFPKIQFPKPKWWKIGLVILLAIDLILIFLPNTVANVPYSNYLAEQGSSVCFNLKIDKSAIQKIENNNIYISNLDYPIFSSKSNIDKISSRNKSIINITFTPESKSFKLNKIVSNIIPLEYPYIIELKERVRILLLHVPLAWNSVVAYLLSMIFAIFYLHKRETFYDTIAVSSAGIGVLFTILATLTGMIWAKFNWGSFWNWDPRETSIFLLLIIYFAYFALRSAIDNPEIKARLSAVYSIIAFIAVPFLVFILPRITTGLHPGAKGEGTAGPVVGSGGMMNFDLMITFALSMFCFSLLFFWILNLKIRTELVANKLIENK
ncbi:MAG: cytochrome c biogenesis protein CcsA [Candidatus Kapabacteria bacterium]|jgi:heme exporter protein C|nr:cytochrome c biogenesis protein CcsA [Candidatus Kapabacteria bacterium]